MMICDALGDYQVFLLKSFRAETARVYTASLRRLLGGQNLLKELVDLDYSLIVNNLSKIRYKNQFSQSKNAFLYFLTSQNLVLDKSYLEQIKNIENHTHKKYRKQHNIDYKIIDKKIKHIRNKKLKLSYQVMLNTGLRVSEISQVTKHDSEIRDNEIELAFIGKGGKPEKVIICKKDNSNLYNDLKLLIKGTRSNNKVFYSSQYLQQKANEYELCCHDLRRIFSKLEYKKTRSKKTVQKKLRHVDIKTTDIYLRSKVKF